NPPGVRVMEIFPNGAAAKAGLKSGDIVTRADDNKVTTLDQLAELVRKHNVGDQLKLMTIRDGKEQELGVTLAEMPALVPAIPSAGRNPYLGVGVSPLTPERKQQLGVAVDQGVVVL